MYNKEEVRSQLIQYFKAVGSGENIVQAIKQALFLNEKFNPLLLFQMLSQGKQKITRNDWKKYLTKRNIHFDEKQIRYFFRHNHFGQDLNLNQFLQSLIPYNADVIREFKAKYLDSLEIDSLDPEIEFIFAQLMKSWIDFIRNLIQIRHQISKNVTRRQIQHLVKQDLVLFSKPREARKFHQAFQQRDFKISFNQLRKFLELWQSQKQLIHEFCLLNVKRHIKCEDPFRKIAYHSRKNRRARSRSRSGSQSASRSISASRSKSNNTQRKRKPNSLDKKRQVRQQPNYNDQQQEYLRYIPNNQNKNRYRQDKYNNFKQSLLNQLKQSSDNIGKKQYRRSNQEVLVKAPQNVRKINYQNGQQSNRKRVIQNPLSNQTIQKSIKKDQIKNEPQRKPKALFSTNTNKQRAQSQFLVKMFQQIILKQQRLQKLRKQVAKSNDFNNNNKGYLSAEAIQQYFSDTLRYDNLVNYYARQKGKLRLQQFSAIFRPLSKQLNQMLDNRQQHRVPNPFKKQTARLITQIIQLQNQMHINLNNFRNRIKIENINLKQLFEFVDSNKNGYISSENIKQILEQNNINCEPKDIKCFMKLFNKKIDEKISQKEFINFINF